MAKVIFLNGAFSAGKTTLGRALQDVLDEPYLLLGLDTCFQMVSARWGGGSVGPFRHLGLAYVDLPPEDDRPMLGISYGPVGWRMMVGFHRAAVELVRAGNSIIIDEMLLDDNVRDDWLAVLEPFRPLLVGVCCDLVELERREATRTSRLGLARWSASRVHTGMRYDATINTTEATPLACAGQFKRWASASSPNRP